MKKRLNIAVYGLLTCLLASGFAAPASAADPVGDTEKLLKRGKIVFLRCRSCHTTNDGGRHLTGPNLNGLLGAKAGVKEGYAFSEALKSSGVVWNEETLDAWLASPGKFVAGNRMVFAGLPRENDRQALIAYLKQETE